VFPSGRRKGAADDAMERQQELMAEFVAGRHNLFAFIQGCIRNPHESEDIFQEVWVRFSRALAEGAEIRDQAKWCRGTARNLILHYWRDRRKAAVPADEELLDLADLAFAEQSANQDYWRARQEALTECIQELPERAQNLLRLKYEHGLPANEVAGRLRQTSAAVLMALSRLRRALRDCAQKKLKLQGLQP
jgi:RNA polymerase sigma-70 factor (ECF subfamily)